MSTVLDACGASRLFGLSAGAVIAIEAALARPDITKLALYEPPLTFDGVVHGDWAPRYERQFDAGKPGAALVTVLKATADRNSVIRRVPRRPLAAALDFAIKRTASRPAPAGLMSPRDLVPTLRYDARTVNSAAGALERFAALSCEVLLLGGSQSARNLSASLDGLSGVLPGATRVVLHGTPLQTTVVSPIESRPCCANSSASAARLANPQMEAPAAALRPRAQPFAARALAHKLGRFRLRTAMPRRIAAASLSSRIGMSTKELGNSPLRHADQLFRCLAPGHRCIAADGLAT